ncbi:MAG: hypothetical protein HQL22_12875, partial [Candidatus Omnitrophica bacterium]|nr:hypothetical protein [Candidatus Omnitrophota bacterium]
MINKKPMTVSQLLMLFEKMKKMTQLYLHLFKAQTEDNVLEVVAQSSSDLVGGRTIAQIFLRLEKEFKEKVKKFSADDMVPDKVIEVLQAYDRNNPGKTSGLVSKGAESYNQDDMDGVTFAEFVNIVHQKGNRNLDTLLNGLKGAHHEFNVRAEGEGVNLEWPMSYVDGRINPDSPLAWPMVYIGRAFAKGQMVHHQHGYFPPESAAIISNESDATIGMKLGVHSAQIQFSLKPVQEGGRLLIRYTDSGKTYAPGSNLRISAIDQAFQAAGFKTRLDGYTLEAVFDKDTGAKSIRELPEKLEFAVQVLTSTKDLDLDINHNALSNDPQAANKIAAIWTALGYLDRPGLLAGRNVLAPWEVVAAAVKERALLLGITLENLPPGQRMLDAYQMAYDRLEARGALKEQGINEVYVRAASASPIEFMLSRIAAMDESGRAEAGRLAVLVDQIAPFMTEKPEVAMIGDYVLSRERIELLGDDITFFVLRSAKDGRAILAQAVLGDFFVDQPRRDLFRGIDLTNNLLGFNDVSVILLGQNVSLRRSVIENFKLKQSMDDRQAYDFLRAIPGANVPVFDKEGLYRPAAGMGLSISPVSLSGQGVFPAESLGQVMFKKEGRSAMSFDNKILVADRTDPQDDESIMRSRGLIVTTGGILSHAAIRSREHKKAAVILNAAHVEGQALRFSTMSSELIPKEAVFEGKTVQYVETKGSAKQDIAISDDDLVFVDGNKGVMYVIAKADDEQTIALFHFALGRCANVNDGNTAG